MELNCLRFCKTVEVRHVPLACQPVDLAMASPPPESLPPLPVEPLPVDPLPVRTVMKLSAIFGILVSCCTYELPMDSLCSTLRYILHHVQWFFANYLYALALEEQSVAVVNILSGLSGAVVLVLAAIPCPRVSKKDKFTLTKLIFVTIR